MLEEERIIGDRVENRQVVYLIKWKNCPEYAEFMNNF